MHLYQTKIKLKKPPFVQGLFVKDKILIKLYPKNYIKQVLNYYTVQPLIGLAPVPVSTHAQVILPPAARGAVGVMVAVMPS